MTDQEMSYVDNAYHLSALTGKIIAAAQAAHRGLGPGFEEVIYQRALAIELPAMMSITSEKCGLK